MATTLDLPMVNREHKTMSIRIGTEALEAAKIAAAFKNMTVMDYVTEVVLEHANRDIEEGYRARSSGLQSHGREKGRKPKGGE
jgi:uncharacterized protein (DUF1778 family)